MPKKRILIVEDSVADAHYWLTLLDDEVEGVHMLNIEATMTLFEADQEFDLVVMDCCVPGGEPNTMGLVRFMRAKEFAGPILANSSISEYIGQLVYAGASHSCNKDEVPEKIKEILGL